MDQKQQEQQGQLERQELLREGIDHQQLLTPMLTTAAAPVRAPALALERNRRPLLLLLHLLIH